MAFPLETQILFEIGLGDNPNRSNGSDTCEYLRRAAAGKLEPALKSHHDAGEEIAPPHPTMMNLMREAAGWDDNQYTLTIALRVCSAIIRAHIEAYIVSSEEQDAFFLAQAKLIKEYWFKRH